MMGHGLRPGNGDALWEIIKNEERPGSTSPFLVHCGTLEAAVWWCWVRAVAEVADRVLCDIP